MSIFFFIKFPLEQNYQAWWEEKCCIQEVVYRMLIKRKWYSRIQKAGNEICMQIAKQHPKSKKLYIILIYLILFVYVSFPFLEMFPVAKEVN